MSKSAATPVPLGAWLSDLPDYTDANAYLVSEPTEIVDCNGNKIASFYTQNRKSITKDEVSPYVLQGTVDVEDERFYEHGGIDLWGIARAAVATLGGGHEGASTITQQLVRNTILQEEQFDSTIERKVREAYIAVKMEDMYSKDEILMMYLNTIYYGHGAYGIEAAAQAYFGKPAAKLTDAQAIALTSIVNNPGNLDPAKGDKQAADLLERYQYTINGMVEMGTMTEAQKNEIYAELPEFPKVERDSQFGGPKGFLLNMVQDELKANAQKLVDTLESFGVRTRVLDISRGPSVTRYEVQPMAGVKISRITSLADDIALNLAVADVRMEAPIPGKPAVGIEVPNHKKTPVYIRSVFESQSFLRMTSPLGIALGKDIAGVAQVADLCKMPHLLIAGSTGSGKSVCVNSIIMSLLFRSSPEDVKLLLIDPKVVELAEYNGIPHLLMPVVTEPRKAAGALGGAVQEMERRYHLFAENNVRDIKSFNKLAATDPNLEKMPYIAIIIDELADLMMVVGKDVEDSICRIAQKARAAGMHLIVATQRPSVDVITGLIKANIPSRIAFAVSSQVDSRTILDGAGAEKLLGQLEARAARNGYQLTHTPRVGAVLAARARSPYGARELRRQVDRAVEQALANQIASGTAHTGQHWTADCTVDGAIVLEEGEVVEQTIG